MKKPKNIYEERDYYKRQAEKLPVDLWPIGWALIVFFLMLPFILEAWPCK